MLDIVFESLNIKMPGINHTIEAARPGTWPKLEYELVTVSGTNNTLGMPVYLLPLDLPHGLQVDDTHGGTLTLPDVPGFALTIAPGSVTFPDGGKSGLVSVTVVHADKVPMTPNFGQQPRFIVSIQPAGAHFNPPAAMTLPNVDGLSPGEVTEMYSFDHDLGSFVAIGTGTVSKDGSVIKSDPGVGIVKGGWHCGGNPSLVGTTADCPDCQTCQINGCVPDPNQNGNACGSSTVGVNSCKNPGVCSGGACGGVTNKADGTSCDDGIFCTTNDSCTGGVCQGTPIKDGLEVKTTYTLGQLGNLINRVSEFLAFIGLANEIHLPDFEGSLELSNIDKCCEYLKSMGTKKSVQGSLSTGADLIKFRPQFPPYTGNFEFDVFGIPLGFAYGVEITAKAKVSALVKAERDCGNPLCWTIGAQAGVEITGDFFGEVLNPAIPPECGPSGKDPCTLAKAQAGLQSGATVNTDASCDQLEIDAIKWSGLSAGVTVQFFEGTFLDFTFSKQVVLFKEATIGSLITIPLPGSL